MPSKRKIKQRKRAELRAADLARCEALIFAEKEAEAVVVTEELVVGAGLPKTETTSPEYLLRKMIVEKISDAEVVVASMKSSIEEKEQLIADNRATLAGSQEETLNLQKQLAILDNISGVTPLDLAPRPVIDSRLATPFVDSKTRGWTKVLDHTLISAQSIAHHQFRLPIGVERQTARGLPGDGCDEIDYCVYDYPNMDYPEDLDPPSYSSGGKVDWEAQWRKIIEGFPDDRVYCTSKERHLGGLRFANKDASSLQGLKAEKGSVVCISPGSSIGLILMVVNKYGFKRAIRWSTEDAAVAAASRVNEPLCNHPK